jgi:hypothetical protein
VLGVGMAGISRDDAFGALKTLKTRCGCFLAPAKVCHAQVRLLALHIRRGRGEQGKGRWHLRAQPLDPVLPSPSETA